MGLCQTGEITHRKKTLIAKKSRASKPRAQMADRLAQYNVPNDNRRAERRGRGLFFFRRFAGTEQ